MTTAGILAIVVLAVTWVWKLSEGEEQAVADAFLEDLRTGRPYEPNDLKGLRSGRQATTLRRAIRWLQLDDRHAEAAPLVAELSKLDPAMATTVAGKGLGTNKVLESERLPNALDVLRTDPCNTRLRQEVAEGLWATGRQDEAIAILDGSPTAKAPLELLRARYKGEAGDTAGAVAAARTAERLADSLVVDDPLRSGEWAECRAEARFLVQRYSPTEGDRP